MIWNILALLKHTCSFIFVSTIIKVNHLYLLSISFSHTLKAFVPYGHVVILSKVGNLLSSLLLSAILLICSVYTLYASLLNLRCDLVLACY